MTTTAPDPRLLFDPAARDLAGPDRSFFLRDTELVAQDLLGIWLGRFDEGKWFGGRIVETEAYLGTADRAAHSWNGRRTPRVEPMYSSGGHLYVYFVYGMHHCANVVTREEGVPEAVLIRALEGPSDTPPEIASGPGKLCRALGITTALSGTDLLADGEVRLFRDPRIRIEAAVSKRIGVDYAGEAAEWPLRFFDRSSPAVSRHRRGGRSERT
jgi:DNA-3-methyladenine glycosylase